MKEKIRKIKNRKNWHFDKYLEKIKVLAVSRRTVILVVIISFLTVAGISYGAIGYHKISKAIEQARQFTKEEKFEEAINELGLAQISGVVKIGIKKQEINNEIEKNKKLIEEKSKYNNALSELNEESYQKAISSFSNITEDSLYYQKAQTKIEEAKRKMVEGKLSEEQVARKSAEVKAKQEEFEKNLKEKQLADKAAEEKMMNTDNDGDSLTYRRELELGTSDWNIDSDGDGIIDSKDTHPAGGGRNIPQTFAWNYGGYNWTFTTSIAEDWYDYYKAKPRLPATSVEYITYNDPFIQRISNKILEESKKDNLCEACLAAAFIQSLPYIEDVYTGYDEYPKYPIETFFEKNGDCEDTSYLTASIILAMNIDAVLILLPGHMAVGVWANCDNPGTYYKLGDKCYYYIETTGDGFKLGDIPDEYRYTAATLVKIPSGENIAVAPQYKKPCDPSPYFIGYYYSGADFYSDAQCNYQTNCLPWSSYVSASSLSGYYYNSQLEQTYHDLSCTQIAVKGCYKSKTYSGYFYKSGLAWYYDSQCTQTYQSMTCSYPYSYVYSCTTESGYNSKKSNCDYYASSEYLKSLAESCYAGLDKCRSDINEYQSKLNEYNACTARKEY